MAASILYGCDYYCYYEKVRTSMRIAIVSNLLKSYEIKQCILHAPAPIVIETENSEYYDFASFQSMVTYSVS